MSRSRRKHLYFPPDSPFRQEQEMRGQAQGYAQVATQRIAMGDRAKYEQGLADRAGVDAARAQGKQVQINRSINQERKEV